VKFSDLIKKLMPRGLRAQLILGIASILVVLMSLLVMLLMNRQKSFFLKLNHERAFALSNTLASTANSYVISYELSGLQKLVSTYKNNPGLQYAIVTSDDGIVLAHTNEKYLGQKATDSVSVKLRSSDTTQILIENNSMLDIATPIINHDKIVGWARVGLSQDYVEPNLTAIRKNGMLFILISLIIGCLFAIIVAGRLSKGLQKLMAAAQKIKAGNKDLRVAPSKSREITELGTAFNQMLDTISSNEKLLGMVLENLPVAVWILDEKGKIISTNPAGKEMWKGIKYVGVDEYGLYKAWFTHTGKEVQPHEWGAAIVLAEGRPVLDQELEIECFDKSHKIILNSAIPLRDANDKITGVITINVDITERKKSEKNIRESEVRFREVLENSLSASYKRNLLTNTYDYLSPVFKKIAGYTQDEMNNMSLETILSMMHPNDVESVRIGITKAIKEAGRSENSLEYRFKHKITGEYRWLKDEFVVMQDAEKQATSLIGSVSDITESKQIEAELIEKKEQLTLFVEHSPASLAMFDTKMKYIATSRRWLNDYNLGSQDIIGKTHYEVFPEIGQEWKEIHQRCLEGAIERREEDSFTRLDGKTDWLRWEIRPWHKSTGEIGGIIMFTEVITERKNAEIKLEQSEEKNRALVENITDGIILIDENSKAIYRSPATQRITGYTFDEVKDKEIFEFVHPDHLASCLGFIQKTYANPGIAFQHQFRIQHKEGHYIWVEGTLINLLHVKSINAFILNYRDITERKKLEEQQLLITSIVDSSDDAIVSKGTDGIITSWNKGAENILGYEPQEAIGRHISMIIPAKLLNEEELILENIRAGRSVEHFQTQRRRKDGEVIDVSLTVSPIKDSVGNVVGASKILRDISERKKAEERIKQSEANYRQLFDNSPAPMWVIDERAGAVIQVNQAAIRNYGYSEEEFSDMKISDISPNQPSLTKKTNMSDVFFMGAHQHVKRSGELIDVITSSIPVKLNGENSILMTGIDVTEKNLYEQKLAKAAIKAQEDERYEIGGELHDNVCQILAGSLMLLGVIKGSLPEKSIGYFDQAYQHINSATDEIRNLSHRLAPAFFDEETLKDALKGLLKNLNVENKYTISLTVDNKVNDRTLSRELQLNLYRILQEQLRNIMKHAKATNIIVGIIINGDILQMRIVDNGIGFDTKTSRGGIGLANMNRRAQLFSGNFTINSAVGKGCKVLVEIPLTSAGK